MKTRSLIVLLAGSFLFSIASAQERPEPPKEGAGADIGDAPVRPATLEGRVAEVERLIDALAESTRKLTVTAANMQTVVEDNSMKLAELAQKLEDYKNDLAQKDAEIEEILSALSRQDSSGRPVLALSNIMQSDDFKQEFSGAVNSALQTRGTLTVENQTQSDQIISINGQSQTIPARSKATFRVSVGTVTTQLVGQEAAKNWTIAPPTYEQGIIIRPAAVEVVTPTVLHSPIVVWP